MAILLLEGFDDYVTNADLGMSAAAVSANCGLITGRGGNGKGAQISQGGNLTFAVPPTSPLIVGFALKEVSSSTSSDFTRIQFQSGGVALFSILQIGGAPGVSVGLQFYNATNQCNSANVTTGLIGSASFKNWQSYIQVKLTAGNPGHVKVLIDGVTVLDTDGNFSRFISTTLVSGGTHSPPYLYQGDTFFTVNGDLGITPPFPFQISGGGQWEAAICTGVSGIGNSVWTCAPWPNTLHSTGDVIRAYPATAKIDGFDFSNQYGNPNTISIVSAIDDLYILDTTGAALNDFLSDTRIISAAPTADGAHLDMTPSAGTTHYNLVAESPLDSDTSYVAATAAAQVDTYSFPNLAALTGVIRAVQVTSYAKTDAGGANTIAAAARIGGVDYVAPAAQVTAVYSAVSSLFLTNPATAAAWTVAAVNAAQFGVKRTS